MSVRPPVEDEQHEPADARPHTGAQRVVARGDIDIATVDGLRAELEAVLATGVRVVVLDASELHFIDKCGHAPMMEQPEEFNVILDKFLKKLGQPATVL